MENDHDQHDPGELSEMERRVRALRTVLAQKGYIDPAALDGPAQCRGVRF